MEVSEKVVPRIKEERKIRTVSARELYSKLGIEEDFMDWLNSHILELVFMRDHDYFGEVLYNPRKKSGLPGMDYNLSLAMAAEIALAEGNEYIHDELNEYVREACSIFSDASGNDFGLQSAEKEILDTIASENGFIEVDIFAQLLPSLKGFSMGPVKFRKWLNHEGLLDKDNKPTEKAPDCFITHRDLCDILKLNFDNPSDSPVITKEGRDHLLRLLDESESKTLFLNKKSCVNREYLAAQRA